MKRSHELEASEFPPPEVMARKVRGIGVEFFLGPLLCAVAALVNAVGHEWMYCAVFAGSSAIYFSISWGQYRSTKIICDRALVRYEEWYEENRGEHGP